MADSTTTTYRLLIKCQVHITDMEVLKIPCDTLKFLLNLLINQVPSLTADEGAESTRALLAMLEKTKAKYRKAAGAAPQTAAAPAAPAAAAPAQSQARCSGDFDPVFDGQDNRANNAHTEQAQLHRATIRKCELVRACAFEFVKAQLALRRSGHTAGTAFLCGGSLMRSSKAGESHQEKRNRQSKVLGVRS
jgi:hypothetical protein